MAADRWQSLMEAAAREFASHGYERASLNRIIRACGMSKSSFYHYVRSKEELFDRLIDDITAALAREIEVPQPHEFTVGDFWARAEELLDRLLDLAGREPSFGDLGRMFYLPGAPAGEHSALGRLLAAIETWLEQTLAVGRACGSVRDDLPAPLQAQMTMAIVRVFDEWGVRHREELDADEEQQLARAQLDALKRLLAPDPAASR
ncbi:TetR/AcrR family transcriptional regulator [Amycolatopsis palatopharyngis]|uniref:TetR/AcrR family transcriptional regulator n=1 Tax=Amycolatopsis palatopharyngis TaxID=187982 RepID=UPI000E23CB55|nr:TetR/AcrR family transcriptional regulator [Amycolatopsis palatopharyngis]